MRVVIGFVAHEQRFVTVRLCSHNVAAQVQFPRGVVHIKTALRHGVGVQRHQLHAHPNALQRLLNIERHALLGFVGVHIRQAQLEVVRRAGCFKPLFGLLQIECVLFNVIRLVKRIGRQERGRRFGVVQRGKGGLGQLVFVDGVSNGLTQLFALHHRHVLIERHIGQAAFRIDHEVKLTGIFQAVHILRVNHLEVDFTVLQRQVGGVAIFGETVGDRIKLRFAVPVIVETGQGVILSGAVLFKFERPGADRCIVFAALFQVAFAGEHVLRDRVDLYQRAGKGRADLR